MSKIRTLVIVLFIYFSLQLPAIGAELSPVEQAYVDNVYRIWDTVETQQGDIQLAGGVAQLDIPENFYFLNPQQAEKLLVDIWENPPGSGTNTLGVLVPSNFNPLADDSYAVTIWYEEDGYVDDHEADEINYDELLESMRENTVDASKDRVKQGYQAIKLVGWAAEPYYDRTTHKMHWAKEMQFGESTDHTLNYNIRVLGRKGVLVLNFIAGMDQLPKINSQLDTVLALADFRQGSRYEDFNPEVDQIAAYGLGALVTGKVLAKTGVLATAMIFLKKFGVFFVLALVTLFGRLFKRRAPEA